VYIFTNLLPVLLSCMGPLISHQPTHTSETMETQVQLETGSTTVTTHVVTVDTADTGNPPNPELAVVTASPPPGLFVGSTTVSLSATEGATIYYALETDELEPFAPYTKPIVITEATLFHTYASANGTISGISTTAYIPVDDDVALFSSDIPVMFISGHHGISDNPDDARVPTAMVVVEPNKPTPLTARAGIKVRGSSSAGHPKKPYALETWESLANEDKDITFLDFPSDSDWVLYAPIVYDRALMRNSLMYALSNNINRYAPRTRFIELFVVDDSEAVTMDHYVGVYAIIEKIKRGDDRVDVVKLEQSDNEEPYISGGYLFKEDRTGPGESGFSAGTAGGQFSFQQSFVNIDPNEDDLSSEQSSWLINYLNTFAFSLASKGAYDTYIDVDSFIDHHILNIFAKNPDGFRLSGYFYKDREGLVNAGPIWDFDRTMGCSSDNRAENPTWWDPSNQTSDTTFYFTHGWYEGLFDDPAFRTRYFDRLSTLLDGELSTKSVHAVVDAMESEISEAAERNFTQWSDYPPRGGSLSTEVAILKTWLEQRHDWMRDCLDNASLPSPMNCVGY
jgi:hypothetical protein